MAVTSTPVPSWNTATAAARENRRMRCTADTETGDYIDDPTEAQLEQLITGLGKATGTFVTITPADDDHDWYASVSLLPDGTTEIDRGDPARGEQHTAATTASPDAIASDLTTWIAARD
jgi:hypothetical protein